MSTFSDTAGQWSRGLTLAQGQNLARRLAEMPANYLTPTRFGEIAVEELGKVDNVEVNVRWVPGSWQIIC